MEFLSRFRRITTSGDYFAEIDGLRFVAIIWVVLSHSVRCLIQNPNYSNTGSINDYPLLHDFFSNGFQGVELFFAISGFILGFPFARHYLAGGKKVELKKYFMRRVTRLEPPYIIAMTLFFLILIFRGSYTFEGLLPSYIASIFYSHFFILGTYPLITMVAWTLEIEVQFYILAPLITKLYKLRPTGRRLLILVLIVIFPVIQWYFKLDRLFIYQFIEFFLCGILLADLYVTKVKFSIPFILSVITGTISFVFLMMANHQNSIFEGIAYPLVLIIFYYLVLSEDFWKKIFGNKLIATVGGMCYSIYLLHYPLISVITKYSHYYKISDSFLPNLVVNSIICTILSVLVSSVYFILIEKPCMDRYWPGKLMAFLRLSKSR